MESFPFLGPTMPVSEFSFSPQRSVNLYPEVDKNYKEPFVLTGTPGYELWTEIGNNTEHIRPGSGIEFNNRLYVVSGSSLWEINKGGGSFYRGTINTSSGWISMAHNGLELIIVDGQDGWLYSDKLTKIIDPDFVATKADVVIYHDTYFVVNEPGSQRFSISATTDGSSWSGTDTASAEFRQDNLVRPADDRELILFGDYTTEFWSNTGNSSFPFEPLRPVRMIYGLAAKRSWVRADNTSIFLCRDDHGGVFVARLNGYTPQEISTPAWNRLWSGFPDIEDAYAFSIFFKGHSWYVITFPSADSGYGRTFLYDARGGPDAGWYEWGNWIDTLGEYGKHPMITHTYFDNKHVIGIDGSNKLFLLKDDVYTNDGTAIISRRRCAHLHSNRDRLFYSSLQIDMEVGQGLVSGQGSDPKIMMQFSNDGGRTWEDQRQASIGKTGESRERVIFWRLGSAYDRVYELTISDPVPRKFIGGYLG